MNKKAKKPVVKVKKSKPVTATKHASPKKNHFAGRPAPVLSDAEKEHQMDERRVRLLAKAAKGPYKRYVQLLLNIRDRLLDDIEFHASDNLKRTQKEASSDLSAYSIHMADAGTDNFDREFALGLVSNEQELLNEINAALGRLENGTYGICEISGKPIPKARLDAIPWARYRVECQSELEKTQKKPSQQAFHFAEFGNSEEETLDKEEEV